MGAAEVSPAESQKRAKRLQVPAERDNSWQARVPLELKDMAE